MEKRQRTKGQLGRARHFLECVILEQQAATEELRASNRELQRLLEEVVATRSELRSMAHEDPVQPATPPPARAEALDRSTTQLKRDAELTMEQAGSAIQESMRIRKRSQRIREVLSKKPLRSDGTQVQGLSKREHQVLTLIVAGKSSKEIAAELGISFKTAVTHRASIMSKLDVHEIASVVREAIHRGLV